MIDLREIISKYPRSAATRAQLASLLHDLYPTEKRAINLVLDVLDSGIASRISSLKVIDTIQVHGFIKQLVDEYGLQEQYALEGISLWAQAYSLNIENTGTPAQKKTNEPKNIKHNPDAYATPGQIVNGSVSDYELTASGNNVIISKFRGFDEADIVVPNVIDGKKVIGVGECAYFGCAALKSLTVSDGITFIENGAFANCQNLVSVILPETLTRIGSIEKPVSGFQYVSVLSDRKPEGAFQESGIQKITLPSGLNYLGKSSFKKCTSLQVIDLPNEIEEIKEYSFFGCSQLSKVTLPERLKTIGSSAFGSCSSLKGIQFPKTLKGIGRSAFDKCSTLVDIILNEGLLTIDVGAFTNCTALKRFLLPSTVKEIKEDSYSSEDIFTITTWHQPYDRRRNGYSVSSKNENVVVYCYAGSYGLEYARKKGYQIQNAANLSI